MKSILAWIIILLTLGYLFFSAVDVFAMADTGRPDGCHTYNLYGHQNNEENGRDVDTCGESITINTPPTRDEKIAQRIRRNEGNKPVTVSPPTCEAGCIMDDKDHSETGTARPHESDKPANVRVRCPR